MATRKVKQVEQLGIRTDSHSVSFKFLEDRISKETEKYYGVSSAPATIEIRAVIDKARKQAAHKKRD